MGAERCPECGGLEMSYRWENKLWDEPVCKPGTCPRWRVIGKSKAGGPLLQLVESPAALLAPSPADPKGQS